MKFRPGENLVRFAAGLLVYSILIALWPLAFWLIPPVLLAVLFLAVQEARALRRAVKQVKVERDIPAAVGRDLPFSVALRVAQNGETELHGELRDVLPPGIKPATWIASLTIPAKSVVTVTQEFRSPRRGNISFGPVWFRWRGQNKLVEVVHSLACPGAVRVLPEGFFAREELVKRQGDNVQLLDKLKRARHVGVGTEFESLAEFRFGDDPRRIDWRTTARYRRPIVRRYQIERHRDIMIIVDTGRLMGADAERGSKLDCAVDASLMLARVALLGGDRCGVGIFDDQVQGYLPPISGTGAMPAIIQSLYNLESRFRDSDFSQMFAALQSRQQKRALVVILSDIIDAETTDRYRASLATLARRHVVLFAALRTPLLNRVVRSPMVTLLDGSRHMVALRIQRDRQRAIHTLRRGGLHVLDVAPTELTIPLINQVTELRQRGLL